MPESPMKILPDNIEYCLFNIKIVSSKVWFRLTGGSCAAATAGFMPEPDELQVKRGELAGEGWRTLRRSSAPW